MPKQTKRVGLRDIAEIAGVSVATVSRVLNDVDGDISIGATTRDLVLKASKELNYRPNPFASALRTQKSGLIGAIVRDIQDPLLNLLARNLQQAAHQRDMELFIGHAGYDVTIAQRQIELMSQWFDGLVVVGDMPGDQAIKEDLFARAVPHVAIACDPAVFSLSVNVDEALGINICLDYLLELGHRRIAFVGDLAHSGTRERLIHFRKRIADDALDWNENYLQSIEYKRKAAIEATQRLLSLSTPPTAIFLSGVHLALGAINGALQMGKRIPEDASIICFDDNEEAAIMLPPLTTIRQPVAEMVNVALETLSTVIDSRGGAFEGDMGRLTLDPGLVVRESCGPPAAGQV